MTCKNTGGTFLAVVLSRPDAAGHENLQEHEHDAKVAELQKENGQLGNNLETLTVARDALTRENKH